MPKKMLFNMSEPEEVRATIVEDGKLVEFDIETRTREKNKNNIYKGYIVQIEPSIQAAFVEYGSNRHGFLPFGEIHPSFLNSPDKSDGGTQNVAQSLRKGQQVVVQVVREEIGNKGAALTTYCTLPGRYLVYMPMSSNVGISRKIENQAERRSLRDVLKGIKTPNNEGFIVRTAGSGMTQDDLRRDLEILDRIWTNIQKAARRGPRVGLIFEDGDLLQRMIRDYYEDDVKEILVDDEEAFERAHAYFAAIMPHQPNVVKHYTDDTPLFWSHDVENQLAQLYQRKIPLPSGGSIVIDATEALVAIDVNSGKTQSDNTEETAYKTNLEAAAEVANQLRLRDLGGLIVIDFIGMRVSRHNRGVERAMRQAVKGDKARVKIGRISSFFGLLTLSRQRIRDAKGFAYFTECPSCTGTGRIPNTESSALSVLRHFQKIAIQDQYERIVAHLPQDLTLRLLNEKRHRLVELEEEYDLKIELQPRQGLALNLDEDLTLHQRRSESRRKPRGRRSRHVPVDQLKAAQEVSAQNSEETPARSREVAEPAAPPPPRRPESRRPSEAPAPRDRQQESSRRQPAPEVTEPSHRQPAPEVAEPAPQPHGPLLKKLDPDSNLPTGLPWFIEHLSPRDDAPPRREVVRWAVKQPNQPPIVLPEESPARGSSSNGSHTRSDRSDRSERSRRSQRSRKTSNGASTPAEKAASEASPKSTPGPSPEATAPAAPSPKEDAAERLRRIQLDLQGNAGDGSKGRPSPPSRGNGSGEPSAPVTAQSRRRSRRSRSKDDAPTSAPKASAPKASAPKASAPKASAPKASAPKASAPEAFAPEASPSSASRRVPSSGRKPKRSPRWTQEELKLLQSLTHLSVGEAHKQFQEEGYDRSIGAFRQKFYNLRS